MRGVVTNSNIGMPIVTAPPNPAFETAVVSAAQKASAINKTGSTTSSDVNTKDKVINFDIRP
jgi:hypothetical protein